MEVRFIDYSKGDRVVRFEVGGKELRAELSPGERVCEFNISNFNRMEQDYLERNILPDIFSEMASDNRLLKKWKVRRRKRKIVETYQFVFYR